MSIGSLSKTGKVSKQRISLFFAMIILAGLCFGETKPVSPDRIEIKGGAVLTGNIIESTAEVIRLQTEYAGIVEVQAAKVSKVITRKSLSEKLPVGLVSAPIPPVLKPKSSQPAIVKKASPTGSKPPVAAKKPPSPAKKKYGWELEGGMNLTGNEGNSEKLDIGLNIDTKYLQKFYRLDLYSRYSYGTNRDKLTSDEIILGGRYTNFFYKKFGFFFREELERDKFEGVDFRSTSAGGFSYKIHDSKVLDLEVRSGLSYRYEEKNIGQTKEFPGMDFGLDMNWQFAPWMNFKGSYGFVPSFNDSDEFILSQDSGVTMPLSKTSLWKIRFGLTSKYNNRPTKNKKQLDHKYYVRLIASWK